MPIKLFIRSFSNQNYSHVHNFNQIVIPLKGSADNFTDKGNGRIGPGQSIVFSTGCKHRFVPDEQSRFLVSESNELPTSLQNLQHPIIAVPPQVLIFCDFVEQQIKAPTS
jgi:D-lyxose ketol-isomerase